MKQLRQLMLVSIIITISLMIFIYLRNLNQFGYIVLFRQIPLYKHITPTSNIWLTGIISFFALVSMSVFVGAFLYHYIMYKNIYFLRFSKKERLPIITTALTLWLWLISFSVLTEMALYTPGHKFRSLVGININYFNHEFYPHHLFESTNLSWIWLIIITLLLIIYKYGIPYLKQKLKDRHKQLTNN